MIWFLILTLDAGRMWNFPAGGWTHGTSPGVEVGAGPIALHASLASDRDGIFARHLSLVYSRELSKKLELTVEGAKSNYPAFDTDWSWNAHLRWTLK